MSDLDKKLGNRSEQEKRFFFELWLIIPCTVILFTYFSFSVMFSREFYIEALPKEIGSVLIGILGAVFACIIAVLTFCMTTKNTEMTTADSKAWFIDTIRAGIISLFFSVAFFIGDNRLGILIVFIIMMMQQYVVFHYYFRKLFKAKRTNATDEDSKSKGQELQSKKWVRQIYKWTRWLIVLLSIIPICHYTKSFWSLLIFVPFVWLIIVHTVYFDRDSKRG